MLLHHIRNATARLRYGGSTFVIDPSLGPAHSWPEVGWIANPQPNPLVDLPISPQDVFVGVDAVLQTHLHLDHFDDLAAEELPEGLPVYCQPTDQAALVERGATSASVIDDRVTHAGTRIHRVPAQHGFGAVADLAGPSSGYVLEGRTEPTTYITGDTVWCDDVARTLARFRPDIVIANAGGAELATGDRLIMDVADLARVADEVPTAHIIAVHIGAVSHCLSTRESHRQAHRHRAHVHVPEDGEQLEWPFAPTASQPR